MDPFEIEDFYRILNQWIPLTFALNSLNRSMGLHDVYPFVIPFKAMEKLSFIHKVCYAARNDKKNAGTPANNAERFEAQQV